MNNAGPSSGSSGVSGSLYDVFNTRTYTLDRSVLLKILALWVQDPTFLTQYRRFCKSLFFSQDDLYLVADQTLKHFDRDGAPPNEPLLRQRLQIYDRLTKKKLDVQAALTAVNEVFRENIVGQKGTLTDWVLEFGKIEHTKQAFRRGVDLLKEGKYQDIESLMTELFDWYRSTSFDDADGGFVEDTILADLANRRVRTQERIPTGIQAIDTYLEGGLGRGQLYTIVGGTGVGKTTACMNFCRGAVHAGEPALFVSTEVQRPRLVDKYHAAITGIPMGLEMIDMEQELKAKVEAYLESRKRLFHIVWFEPYSMTMADIRNYLQFLNDHHNFFPKLVVFDSPDLLKAQNRYMKPHEALAEVWTSLFALTGKENFATVASTDVKQGSRDNLLIGVTDIGGTYEKAKKSDGVFGLGRDRKRHPVKADGTFTIWFNIDKLRTDGSDGLVLELEVAPRHGKWTGNINTVPPERIKEELDGVRKKKDSEKKERQQPEKSHY